MELLGVELNELSATSWARSIDGYEIVLTIDSLGDFAARVTHPSSGLIVTGHGEHLSDVAADLRMALERRLDGIQGALALAHIEPQRVSFLRAVRDRLGTKADIVEISLDGSTWTVKLAVGEGSVILQCKVAGNPYSMDAAWDVAHKVLSYFGKMILVGRKPLRGRRTPIPKWQK